MPDITVSFTDAQWTRIVAATSHIKGPSITDSPGDVTVDYFSTLWKQIVSDKVKEYEKQQASIDDF